MTQKISAVIITFNEERNIVRCLRSVAGIADEIVVVDSYSTDATKALCLPCGVRFIEHAFESYIAQKNWALQQAACPIVLSIDADEALSDELQRTIAQIKRDWRADGYFFSRTTFLGAKPIRHGAWYPDYKLRLFDKRRGQFGGVNPHDHVIMQPGARVMRGRGTILHYSFASTDELRRQSERFAVLSAQAMFAQGKTITRTMLALKTGWAFLHSYLLKAGFLDGRAGFTISRAIAASTRKKYALLRRLSNEH